MTGESRSGVPPAITWSEGTLRLLDQRLLPHTVRYLNIDTVDQAVEAIATLAVRGAPAIGIAAAYALVRSLRDVPASRFPSMLAKNASRLKAARPTAVNLAHAVDRLVLAWQQSHETRPAQALEVLLEEAVCIHQEDRQACRAIGEAGLSLIRSGCRVLTHCNAGALAVSELGTATAPLYLAHARGTPLKVWVDETRPLFQGARLTAWELDRAGIDVTVICDGAAASFMAAGEVDLVIVGTDRVTANGDVVNKIGTLTLAVLCNRFQIPFYVACPTSTFDPHTRSGDAVTIEERDPGEVLGNHGAAVRARNPAFDVTPAELVTALITDRGLIDNPVDANLVRLLS